MPPITTDLSSRSPRDATRPSSLHSNPGSISSANESVGRGGASNSDWSEIGHDEARDWTSASGVRLQRAKRSIRHTRSQKVGSSASSSRSRLTDHSVSAATSSPVPPTPPAIVSVLRDASLTTSPVLRRSIELDIPYSPTVTVASTLRKGTTTPTFFSGSSVSPISERNSPAEPSRPNENMGIRPVVENDGMDSGTRALIEHFKREEVEAREVESERRRQLEADEEYARKEQQSERDVWQSMQQDQVVQRLRQQEQDEVRAVSLLKSEVIADTKQREVAEEEHRIEERRLRQEVARTAWEAERQEAWEEERLEREAEDHERSARNAIGLLDDQSQLTEQRRMQGLMVPTHQRSLDIRNPSSLAEGQNPSQWPARQASHPGWHQDASRQNLYPASRATFEQSVYQSPPSLHQADMSGTGLDHPSSSRPPENSGIQSDDALRGQTRFNDPSSQQTGRTPSPASATLPVRRQKSPRRSLFSALRNAGEPPPEPTLTNMRSMSSLHASTPEASVFHSPHPGISPQSGPEERSYNTAGLYRISSADRTQDGRYLEPSRSAPTRGPPLQISSPSGTVSYMPFPSPQPQPRQSGFGFGSRYDSLQAAASSQAQTPKFSNEDLSSMSRRQTAVQEVSRIMSAANSQQSSRPSTINEDASTTTVTRGIAHDGSYPSVSPAWRPRSDSASAAYQALAPMTSAYRRASDPNTTDDDSFDSQLPYSHEDISQDPSGSSISRSINGSDSASVADTISSGVSGITIRPRSASGDVEEGDSNNTAKAGEFSSQIRAMIEQGEGTARPSPEKPLEADDKEEATLFYLTGPIAPPGALSEKSDTEPTLLRPNLKLNMTTVSEDRLQIRPSSTPSDSATESESESRITRARSFARPKDQPEQWHVRPEPEQLYEHLDNFFPKIDLDRPFVETGPSTPSTPAAESPSRLETSQLPLMYPSRQPSTPTASPRSADQPRPLPPPLHPSRAAGLGDRRKSIRVVVDHKRRTIQRESRNVDFNRDAYAVRQDARRLDRRKSSSMWGHRIQEVNPSKLVNGQVPSTIPESPSVDGKPSEWNKVLLTKLTAN